MIPTVVAMVLAGFALAPIAVIVGDLRDDTAEAKDLKRLTGTLPHPRMSLMPVRRAPAQDDAPPTEVVERVLAGLRRDTIPYPWTLPLEPELAWLYANPRRRRAAAGDVTQEFRRIVAAEFGVQRCDSCTVGFDLEKPHASCPGCSCPCKLAAAEPLPAGVDGYAIAGGTR